jgi:hypothetical protein
VSDTVITTVLNNLYDQIIAEAFIAAEITAERLKTFDGSAINDFSAPSMMTIGGLPITDDLAEISSEWDWATLGVDGTNAQVDDVWHIPCGIHTFLGEANLRTARTTALALFTHAMSFIRGTTLGIPQVMWCMPQLATIRQSQTADGAEVLIAFSAHVQTRI